jgi:hypothetical protein
MHSYYESQMESIFLEKVSAIQKNVADWEKKFNEEKQKDIEKMKLQQQRQIEKLLQE